MKSKESYKHLLRKYKNIIENRFKKDLKRGCALDEHQKEGTRRSNILS